MRDSARDLRKVFTLLRGKSDNICGVIMKDSDRTADCDDDVRDENGNIFRVFPRSAKHEPVVDHGGKKPGYIRGERDAAREMLAIITK